MKLRTVCAVGATVLASLACGGVGIDTISFEEEAKLDAGDEAEAARKRGDFAGAEAILNRRLTEDPSDARSRRLLGDVNFSRGQRFAQRWKENLVWSREAYAQALTVDPTSCLTWGRIALASVAAAENEAVAPSRQEIEALPLDLGWEHCPGTAMMELELLREPTKEDLDRAWRALSSSASNGEAMATAAPWQVEAVARIDLSSVEWQKLTVRPEPLAGRAWVVLDGFPLTASSVGGSKPRRFTWPEWLTIRQLSGERLVYLDRRFPERIPEQGIAQALGCPGTDWKLEPPDNIAVGECTAGRFDKRASEVYDPKLLRTAGIAHFHHPSIIPAQIDWLDIAEDSISCLGGPVGRMFVDIPSCKVAYDRAIPQMRSVPADAGVMALNAEHAQQMVDLARAGPQYGEELAMHMALGEIGIGMPYALFAATLPDVTGCKGRGMYVKTDFIDGATEFACTLGANTYEFREMTLVAIKVGKSTP